ncbi:LacI family DNA-binding transcriptional regulator [Rhizorhabdus histidinilytica]
MSVGTASKVVNNDASVRAATREKVQQAIAQIGYAPDAIAQSMRMGSTNTIGCILRDMTIPLLTDFVRAAHDTLATAGISLLISNSEGREDRERALLANLSRRRVDGVIMGPYSPISGEFREFLSGLNVPVVLLDRNEASWLDAVMIDHRDGMYQAVKRLLDLGHRRIALITGDQRLYPARERLRGFQEAHADRGLMPEEDLVIARSFLSDAAYDIVTEMMQRPDPPSAIVAGGMDMLSGVLRAIRASGLEVPRDVSVIGSGNSELAELYSPPIAMIDWDYANVGRIAANLLLDRIGGDSMAAARHVIVPTHFIERASIGRRHPHRPYDPRAGRPRNSGSSAQIDP